jgi:hypothetical protein
MGVSVPVLPSELKAAKIWRLSLDVGSWCRGLTCLPVTEEIAGSNPVEPAIAIILILGLYKPFFLSGCSSQPVIENECCLE